MSLCSLAAHRREGAHGGMKAREVQLEADRQDRGRRERVQGYASPGRLVRFTDELDHGGADLARHGRARLFKDERRRRVGNGWEGQRANGRDWLIDVGLQVECQPCETKKGPSKGGRLAQGVAVGASGPPPSDGVASESAALSVA